MEWATYADASGGDAVQYLAPVSLEGIDYSQWVPILAISSGIGVCALAVARISKTGAVFGSLALALALVGVGVWLEVGARERAYERGFLVVAHNIIEATGGDQEVAAEDIPRLERAFALDHEDLMQGIRVAPGAHAPLAAGLVALLGSVLWLVKRRTNEDDVGPTAPILCGATLSVASSLMVWLQFRGSFPMESALILVDHPSFTGLDLLQGPLLVVCAAALVAVTLVGRGRSLPRWLVRGLPIALIVIAASTFVTARNDALDESLGKPEGLDEAVSLARLDETQTELGAEKLFTDQSALRFELGSVAPLLGGALALLGALQYSPDRRRSPT
ncbi:MAG TPA: hypothetical protein VHJ76_05795 [Actinomycetota bacterium]|nr:hypothetical protein [Actinomycetota bacterium]